MAKWLRAKSRAMSKQARRQHARIVEHDQFVAAKQIRKFAEVRDRSTRRLTRSSSSIREASRSIQGPLSDTRRRKFVIEFA